MPYPEPAPKKLVHNTKQTSKTPKLSGEFILPAALDCPTTFLLFLGIGKK